MLQNIWSQIRSTVIIQPEHAIYPKLMTVFILMPSILLSGFMFPFDGMPRVAQWIGEILPTTHFIRLTRGIMLREAGIGELLPEVIHLAVFTGVAMTAAAARFTKRLD